MPFNRKMGLPCFVFGFPCLLPVRLFPGILFLFFFTGTHECFTRNESRSQCCSSSRCNCRNAALTLFRNLTAEGWAASRRASAARKSPCNVSSGRSDTARSEPGRNLWPLTGTAARECPLIDEPLSYMLMASASLEMERTKLLEAVCTARVNLCIAVAAKNKHMHTQKSCYASHKRSKRKKTHQTHSKTAAD